MKKELIIPLKEKLISFETAKLAKEKGFHISSRGEGMGKRVFINGELVNAIFSSKEHIHAPTQSLLQKFIREKRGVHIEIHRNASGWYWSMCKEDGGTDLGWSDHTGPNMSGVWDSFEDALENALQVQLSYDLPGDTKLIKHWGNYVEFALKSK